ncbi:MAG TPA: cysteine desulfurase [Ruminococcaceae bacterium]|nr:cysteine desulfurase [Oscillospiraceae bacterium]HCO37895.1 cysteine desulfurase [Oscillospiraceae bacterium]
MAYLDNSATTKPDKAVADKIYEMLTVNFGNPSSFHKEGLNANLELRAAREKIANALSCESEEIYFTSGGTEANNLAILGAAEAGKRKGKRIVTTAIEHESVLQSVDELEKQGFEVIRLMPDKQGRITEQQVFDAVNSDTTLVSMMYVNNEVGSIMPVKSIKKAVKRANAPALIHIDCVQAFGKLEVKPSKLGADLVTVTAHKIHGPKGVGALYLKKGTRILPRVFGGEQEKKLRPGTEAIPLIAGFGVAADLIPDLKKQSEKIKEINTYAREGLLTVPGVKINSGDDASDYIINLFVPTFMTSQTVVQHLSSKYGVYVSNGSACAKGKRSHVLTAMKLDDKIIEKSIRVSFSRTTTKGDIDEFVNAIKETVVQYPM